MSDTKKTHSLNKVQTAMAVLAMSTLFTLWNIFATADQKKDECEVKLQSALENSDDNVVENKSLRYLLKDNCLIGTGGS